jgi:hypothetical protein
MYTTKTYINKISCTQNMEIKTYSKGGDFHKFSNTKILQFILLKEIKLIYTETGYTVYYAKIYTYLKIHNS